MSETTTIPLLERYVGLRVVAEVVEDETVHEHVGVLKEYSADFIELLDVYYPLPQKVDIKESIASQLIDTIELQIDGQTVKIIEPRRAAGASGAGRRGRRGARTGRHPRQRRTDYACSSRAARRAPRCTCALRRGST